MGMYGFYRDDFHKNEIYVGNGGRFTHEDCKRISAEEKEKIASFFSAYLLKIHVGDESSYDNSDDERVSDSYHSSSSCVYREVNVEDDLHGLVLRDGEVTGVVFYVKDNSRNVYATVFNFNGVPKTYIRLGYSASHSSSYTTVSRVELVKKGENGAPERAKEATFIQHEMYPDI